MASWNLTTKSPKKSGYYLTVSRYGTGDDHYIYTEPAPTHYSVKYDRWNTWDHNDDYTAKKNAIADLRNQGARYSCIYAWFKPTKFDAEKLEKKEAAE